MEKFKFKDFEASLIKSAVIPMAIYQFINNKVHTILLSQGLLDLFQLPDNESTYNLLDNDMYRYVHPEDVARVSEVAIDFAKNDTHYNVFYRYRLNGKYRIIHSFGKHFIKDGVTLSAVWYVDEGDYNIDSERNSSSSAAFSTVLHEESVYRKNNYDSLTGFPSISYFFEIAESEYNLMIQNGKVPVMLFFDLNGMKYYNIKYGFANGDKLIRSFSRLLANFFNSDNCCRFGMDHFCVTTDSENLEERLWSLFGALEDINMGKSLPVRVGIFVDNGKKIGAAFACDCAKMACDSDRSSYASHFTYFSEDMYKFSLDRQYIIDNFERALENEWIQVYYQPIVRASNKLVCDEEALARWIDPEKGFMNPADFIPALEEANLIYKLDLYVLEQILQKFKLQQESGIYLVPVSVNLSRSDFKSCDIVEEIRKRVDESGFERRLITIEITESIIGDDFDYLKSQVERFQKLGFSVWMDDFGSGYSSINVLQNLKFDLVKFDMKFMQQFYQNEKSRIILTDLMRMMMNLGIDTVCEGVENVEQFEFLRDIGCTKIQGYYFSNPNPLKEVLRRYKDGKGIGFENPDETDYYVSLGRVNLYDLSIMNDSSTEVFENFYNILPMAVIELNEDRISIVRCNKSYREFFLKYFGEFAVGKDCFLSLKNAPRTTIFGSVLKKCIESSKPEFFDENFGKDGKIHAFVKQLKKNPVKNIIAFVVVVLESGE